METNNQKIIFQRDIEREIIAAESEGRDANFSNQTIQELNLSNREIRCGLHFKDSVFLGSLYFGKTSISGDLVLEGAVINNALYAGELTIGGNFSGARTAIKNSFNGVNMKVDGNFSLENAYVQGFLSLNRAHIKGRVDVNGIKVISLESPIGVIKGDFYMQNAKIEESFNMKWGYVSGMADFQGLNVWTSFDMSDSKVTGILVLKGLYTKEEPVFERLECQEKIVSF